MKLCEFCEEKESTFQKEFKCCRTVVKCLCATCFAVAESYKCRTCTEKSKTEPKFPRRWQEYKVSGEPPLMCYHHPRNLTEALVLLLELKEESEERRGRYEVCICTDSLENSEINTLVMLAGYSYACKDDYTCPFDEYSSGNYIV